MQLTIPLIFSLAALAAAKTDLEGCTSSSTVAYGGASIIWYVPDSGEICAFLDCGGGMAPPKTTVPGCAAYSGTATYSPSYLPGFGSSTSAPAHATSTSSSSSSSSAVSIESSATITTAPEVTSAASTLLTGTVETSAASTSSGASSSSASTSGSSSSASSGLSSSNVSTGAAPLPTGMRGALGMAAGVFAGVALL
ncbi:hypothetical protein GGR57DRAFT_474440 [Xylariaceae sp. FL1272]|nr:hypothetical protein GGR57DRAFT_474440 [Xylariaceae sp. FL1272]